MKLRQAGYVMMAAALGVAPLAGQCTPRALIVGISAYQDPDFSRLPHAKSDALAFSEWFKNATCGNGAGGSNRPVVKTLLDDAARQTDIARELSLLRHSAGLNDEVFIFISGRGIKTPDYSEGYLMGYDSVRGKLHSSGFSVENLKHFMPAQNRVFLFADVSRDLPDRNTIATDLQTRLESGAPLLGAVLSAGPKQISLDGTYPEGLFTHFLMAELQGGRGRTMSIDALYQNLRQKVQDASKRKQDPMKFGAPGQITEWFPETHVLLAALNFIPRGALGNGRAFQQRNGQPAQAAAGDDYDALTERSFRLEQEAQRVFLRYGEGNQFPDDPARPGAAEFERAAQSFEEALQIRPAAGVKELDDRLRASLQARALFSRGRAMAYRGEYDAARASLEQARTADPLMAEPRNAIGVTYLEQARYGEAAAGFREAIRLAPDWAYPRHNLALTYIEMGDNAAAEAEYRAAIKRTPQHPYLYYNLGVLLQRINRRADAAQMFREAIAKFEEEAGSYNGIAASLSQEDPDSRSEAALAIEQARTVRRNEGEAYNAAGALWQAEGKLAKARASYCRASMLDTRLAAAQYNLAALQVRERRYVDAIRLLQSVIQSNPQFPEARELLDRAQAMSRGTDGKKQSPGSDCAI